MDHRSERAEVQNAVLDDYDGIEIQERARTMATANASFAQTEDFLTEVSEQLTYITGEDGLGRKVVDDMCDFFRLDEIRCATAVEFPLSGMHPYLDDSAVSFVGIQSILAILENFASTTYIIRNMLHNHES
jgi:hypothetical protein